MNWEQAKQFAIDAIMAKAIPHLIGKPGVGKSSIYNSIAKDYRLKFLDVRLNCRESVDLSGYPSLDTVNKVAQYIPFEEFPIEGETPLPTGFDGWLLCLDDFDAADPHMQKACMKLLLGRQVGMKTLHSKCILATAGNRVQDRAGAFANNTAIQSRMVHANVDSSFDGWLTGFALKAKMDPDVIGFLASKPDMLNDFDPSHTNLTYACERTWETFDRFKKIWETKYTTPEAMQEHCLEAASGIIGPAAATEFFTWLTVRKDLPKLADVLANPLGHPLPQDMGVMFMFLSIASQNVNVADFPKFLDFVQRAPAELQVFANRIVTARCPNVVRLQAFTDWATKVGALVNGVTI